MLETIRTLRKTFENLFKQIKPSKPKSAHPATSKKDKEPTYCPSPLACAAQHVDTEALPDHFRRRQIAERFEDWVVWSSKACQKEI
jgi:hypothetical protein